MVNFLSAGGETEPLQPAELMAAPRFLGEDLGFQIPVTGDLFVLHALFFAQEIRL
jgi:hypothetical protein